MKIKDQMRRLSAALATELRRPRDVSKAIAAAPPVGTLPLPEITWAWLGVANYLEKKRWAIRVVEENFPPLPLDHWRMGYGDSPQYEYEGLCPHHPDWECSLRGTYGYLIHRLSGAKILLSFSRCEVNVDNRELDDYYRVFNPTTDFQRRLGELFPHDWVWHHPLRALQSAGLLGVDLTLRPKGRRHVEWVPLFLDAFAQPGDRLWLAVEMGDWPWAYTLAKSERPDLRKELASRAKECRRRWLSRLRRCFRVEGIRPGLLHALAAAKDPRLSWFIETGLTGYYYDQKAALEIVQSDPSWCDHVYSLLRKELRKQRGPDTAGLFAKYLWKHGHRVPTVIRLLRKAHDPPWDAVILLALRGDPEQLADILPKAIRSYIGEYQETAAAVLVLLESRWSRQVLTTAIEDWSSMADPMICYAALLESHQGSLPTWVAPTHGWQFRADDPKTMDDFRCRQRSLQERMQELAEMVYPVRSRLPCGS